MLKQQTQLKSPTAFLIRESRKVSRTVSPKIVWEVPSPDFDIPDEPMDNLDQSLLAEALRDALSCTQHLSKNQLCATSLAVCVKVGGQTITKAPDWFYVPYVIQTDKNRRSYTPIAEGKIPTIVMEFLSDNKGNEYNDSHKPPYGKWYFYEKILKVSWYMIFNSDNGKLEVYQLEKGYYKRQTQSQNGRYWIDSLQLFLGVWFGAKEDVERKTFWLCWWDVDGNRLPWQYEKTKRAEIEKQQAEIEKQKAELEKQQALEQAEQAELEKQQALEQAEHAELEKQQALEHAELEKQHALEHAELEKQQALEHAELEKQQALEHAEKVAKEKIYRIAKQMLQAHVEIAVIAQVTGLDEGEILEHRQS
ncbi:MAG: Uma2 family endonuclease [Candidatus Parabeggiatoa sp.]|nr:Uma2 family endonuclease [Candidatus Parabeggiatoa sp.]